MVHVSTPGNVAYYEEFAGEYPLFFDDLEQNMREEGEWLDRVLRQYGATTVLDASCGSGRQTIPLARRGYRVTAADPSRSMLDEARHTAASAGLDIAFHEAAFVDLPSMVDRSFDAVIALGNGLCNQDSYEDIIHSLRAVRFCLSPEGVCLMGIKDFDLIGRERPRFHGHRVEEGGEERRIFFEVWEYQDPILVCGAYSLRGAGWTWDVHCAETREYMLGEEDMGRAARAAGFSSVQRLDHPSEAVYLLR